MAEDHRGRSLYWLRTLLGLPAQFATAAAAAENSGPRTMSEPPLGAVVWYASEPWGNCALALGDSLVLALDIAGDPSIRGENDPALGTFIGWTRSIGTASSAVGIGRSLTEADKAELTGWVFRFTDGEVISDPQFRVVDRIVQGHMAQAWDRAHTLLCPKAGYHREHTNPYTFSRA